MEFPTERRRQAGGVLPVLLVVALVAAAGAVNYRRNLQAEPPRPYAQYGDAELEQLVLAYQEDVEQLGEGLPAARSAEPSRTQGGLSERVADFEAVQRRGERYRSASAQLAGQQGVLRELEKELDLRAGGSMTLHLRRLTTL